MQNKIIKKENGQAMVEFALVLPIILLLIGGIIDFGWIFYNQLSINNATREATRYVAVHYNLDGMTDPDATTTAENMILLEVKTIITGSGDATATFDAGHENVKIKFEGKVNVLTPILWTILGDEYTLKSDFTMRVEQNS